MSIKEKSGPKGRRFVASAYLGNYTRRKRSFKNKKEAQHWVAEQQTLANGGQLNQFNLYRKKDFELVATEWLTRKILPQRSPKTASEYKSILNKHLLGKFGRIPIQKVVTRHADEVVMACRKTDLSPKTINKIMMVFKQVLKFAEIQKYILKNPLFGYAELRVQNGRIDYFTVSEIHQLLRTNRNEHIYPILVVALNTGMRLGEIFGLCWDRVDFSTNVITVSRSLSRLSLQEVTKTHLIRHIPMNDTVKALMRELFTKQRSPKYIFCKENGSPFNPDHFGGREFKRAIVKANLRKLRFHDLRHTYASQYMMSGGDIYDLQRILGHSKIEMTQKYAHLSPNYLAKQVNLIRFNGDDELPQSNLDKIANLGTL